MLQSELLNFPLSSSLDEFHHWAKHLGEHLLWPGSSKPSAAAWECPSSSSHNLRNSPKLKVAHPGYQPGKRDWRPFSDTFAHTNMTVQHRFSYILSTRQLKILKNNTWLNSGMIFLYCSCDLYYLCTTKLTFTTRIFFERHQGTMTTFLYHELQ